VVALLEDDGGGEERSDWSDTADADEAKDFLRSPLKPSRVGLTMSPRFGLRLYLVIV
jgi:hypothetical protein